MAEKRGRKPKYTECSDMEKKIAEYFSACEGTPLFDEKGAPILDKKGNPIYINKRPLTITGLALALGFNSRKALLEYQEKPEFGNAITRAKARVEQYAEERLFDTDGAKGAQFTLRCNFGWKDESTNGDNNDKVVINITGRDNEPT